MRCGVDEQAFKAKPLSNIWLGAPQSKQILQKAANFASMTTRKAHLQTFNISYHAQLSTYPATIYRLVSPVPLPVHLASGQCLHEPYVGFLQVG
jgi:hypothetical protein